VSEFYACISPTIKTINVYNTTQSLKCEYKPEMRGQTSGTQGLEMNKFNEDMVLVLTFHSHVARVRAAPRSLSSQLAILEKTHVVGFAQRASSLVIHLQE
jgi:hypothetical protein